MKITAIMIFLILCSVWFFFWGRGADNSITFSRINGVNFVAPFRPVSAGHLAPIKRINANWIAFSPFAYSKQAYPLIVYNMHRQEWGETPEGIIALTRYARQRYDLHVMLKPMVWVRGEGWPGNFILETEEAWQLWEKSYEAYLLPLASLADSLGIEMLCIGTEYRLATQHRPLFWKRLIRKIRGRYRGKLTYAANWDEYQIVSFWDTLDYIGINAYFPISEKDTPNVEELLSAWKVPFDSIDVFQKRWKKPVIFTEYGYRSTNKAAWRQWELKHHHDTADGVSANPLVQLNAYDALYRTFWNEPWFAGGFLWKWYDEYDSPRWSRDTDYTPQNKPVEELIKKVYGETL